MYTVKDAAQRLGASEDTVRRWLRDGRIAGVMPGGNKLGYRIPESEIERLLAPQAPIAPRAPRLVPAPTWVAVNGPPGLAPLLRKAEECRLRGDLAGAARWQQHADELVEAAGAPPSAP